MRWGRRLRLATAAAVVALPLVLAGCAGTGTPQSTSSDPSVTSSVSGSPGSTSSSPSATPTRHYPTGPPLQIQSIAPLDRATVGVAMPISIVFTHPVTTGARARIESHLAVTTSTPVVGAWHWFSARRVDFRPQGYWASGTTVTLAARLKHVGDGNGRYGTHTYTRDFTIGADVRTHVDAKHHVTVVTRNGTVLRRMPSDAGSKDWPSWTGTMAVVAKERTVRMDSCSVEIACDKDNPDFYDLTLPWDVRITWSGTFLHYSPADPYPGHSYGSHGCVHLSLANAKWFYQLSKPGDPVTITGSPRRKADGDNGYAGYNLTWPQWLSTSTRGQFTT